MSVANFIVRQCRLSQRLSFLATALSTAAVHAEETPTAPAVAKPVGASPWGFNLTAYLCGLPVGEARWTLSEINRLLFLRDLGDTEVGGFGISAADDLLFIEDVQLVQQVCTGASVAFDDHGEIVPRRGVTRNPSFPRSGASGTASNNAVAFAMTSAEGGPDMSRK